MRCCKGKFNRFSFGNIAIGFGNLKKINQAGGAAFDADYQLVLDYATSQGYTLPSLGQQIVQNQLVLDLKDDSLWSALDSLFVMATDGDADFALVDWIRLTTATAVNSPTFTPDVGYSGNGTTSYINSGLVISSILGTSSYQQNDASTFVYQTWDVGQTDQAPYGVRQDTVVQNRNQLRIRNVDYRPAINDNRPIIGADYRANNWHHQRRDNSTNFTTYTGATSFVNAITSADPARLNGDMFILGINLLNGGVSSLFKPYSGTLKVFGLGGAMDNANLKTAIDDYLNAI